MTNSRVKIKASPIRKIDKYEQVDMCVFVISVLILGINYIETNSVFFTTVLVLILSPLIHKIEQFMFEGLDSFENTLFVLTNLSEVIVMVLVSMVSILGIIGVVEMSTTNVNGVQQLVVRVVEGYVFLAGVSLNIRWIFAALFLIVGLKLFNAYAGGFIVLCKKERA